MDETSKLVVNEIDSVLALGQEEVEDELEIHITEEEKTDLGVAEKPVHQERKAVRCRRCHGCGHIKKDCRPEQLSAGQMKWFEKSTGLPMYNKTPKKVDVQQVEQLAQELRDVIPPPPSFQELKDLEYLNII